MIQINQNQKIKFLILVVLLKKQIIITDIESKIHDVINLATKTALTAVENKIPSVSCLVKEKDSSTKIAEIENNFNYNHEKYITNP